MTPAEKPFSATTIAAMLAVGLICFTGFVLLLAFARGPGESDGGTHAASRSATGFAGLIDLLQQSGTPASISRAPLEAETGTASSLLVLTPGPGTTGPASLPDLRADTILIVLPKWRTTPDPDHPGWVRQSGLLPPEKILATLPRDYPKLTLNHTVARPLTTGPLLPTPPPIDHITQLQTLSGTFANIALSTAGQVILGQLEEDGPWLLSDPDFLNDLAMANLPAAQAATALILALADGGTVAFDVSLNGYGRSRDPLRLLFVPPLLGGTLCAAAAAVLIGLLSARRFGPTAQPGRAVALGKQALADNAAALIARAGRQLAMATPYAALIRHRAARAARLPRHLTPIEIDTQLDRAAADPTPIATLRADAEAATTIPTLLAAATRLHRWKTGIAYGPR